MDSVAAVPERKVAIDDAIVKQRSRLLEFIRKRVHLDADAEDIVQEVLAQWVGFGVAEPIEKLSSWLYTVARNKIIDWYRKGKPDSFSSLRSNRGGEDQDASFEELLFDVTDLPDEVNFRDLLWEEIELALAELPPGQREVFVMYELEGMSFKEIARVTGEPVNTLLSRKRYAVMALRERLRDLYDEIND